MENLVTFMVFCFSLFFILGFLFFLFEKKLVIQERIDEIGDQNGQKRGETQKSTISQRMIYPLYQRISRGIDQLTPGSKRNKMIRKLEQAGILPNQSMERYIISKYLWIGVISILFGSLSYIVQPNVVKSIILAVSTGFITHMIQRFLILKRITKRKENIIKVLPYTLDLITVSVEAGLSFDGAITRVTQNITGDLSDEFRKTLKELRMGIQRKQALKNMSDRCDIKQLSMLIRSLIQADELGVSLGNVLRIESAQLREQRKQAAREKAMKAPIKMLFPLIFFIFPSIFVIILGPAVIRIFEIFGGD